MEAGGERGTDSDSNWRRLPVDLATICLAIAVLASGALLLDLTAPLTFNSDEWDLVLLRQGWGADAFLAPFNEHIVIAPSMIYHVLLGLFGQGSARPFQVAAIGTFLLCAVLLFIYVRRRIGEWPALIATGMILFLGASFENLVWSFQIGYFGSIAAGLGALIALDRDDRNGDFAAAVLLVVSVSFSSLAVPFVAGAWAELILNPRERRRRLFVPLSATVFYLLWWLGWGHDAESYLSFSNLLHAPEYMFNAAAAGFTSLFGLATGDGSEPSQPNLIWGKIMLVAAIGLGTYRVLKFGKLSRGLVITLVIGLTALFLSALNQFELRPPTSSRYQLGTAIFIILIAAELLRGMKFRLPVLLAAGLIAALSIHGGIGLMKDEVAARWVPTSESIQASLAALTIAGDSIRPDFPILIGLKDPVPVETFRNAIRNNGPLGFSETELQGKDGSLRVTADSTLISALGIKLAVDGAEITEPRCRTIRATSTAAQTLSLNPGPHSILNRSGADLPVLAGRFADTPVTSLGSILPRSTARLDLPADGSSRPWLIAFAGDGKVTVCEDSSS